MKVRFQKGNCILVSGIWYILIEIYYKDRDLYFNTVCDHANNRFTWSITDIDEVFDIKDMGYKSPKHNRQIPYNVIAEVLAGQHDDMFDDYWEEEND